MSDLFLLNAGLFPFSLSEICEILVSPSICTKIRNWRFHRTEEFFRKLTHHPYLDGHLGQSGTRYQPQFCKVGLCPSPPDDPRLSCFQHENHPETLQVQLGLAIYNLTGWFTLPDYACIWMLGCWGFVYTLEIVVYCS